MHFATDILANAVINGLMAGKHASDPRAAAHDVRGSVKLFIQDRAKVLDEAMREGKFEVMGGEGKTVEIDETYVGGKEANKHRNKRIKGANGGIGKEAVFSLVERGGSVRSHHVASVSCQVYNSPPREGEGIAPNHEVQMLGPCQRSSLTACSAARDPAVCDCRGRF